MRLATVVPNWNGAHLLHPCLESLLAQAVENHVIVVDNGSHDGSVDLVRRDFPGVTVLPLPRNIGFAGGANAGIEHARQAGFDAVALLNNDACADDQWLANLARALTNDRSVGIVTGKLMRWDRVHIDSAGDCYSIWGIPFPRGRNQVDVGQFDVAEDVLSATGGASLYRMSMIEDVGGFDPHFFAYYEDVDLSLRARLAGWTVRFEPSAVAYHRVSATSSGLPGFTPRHVAKNSMLLYVKNMPGRLFWQLLPRFALFYARQAVGNWRRGTGLPFLQGFWQGLMLIPYAFSKRRHIQRSRKARVADIERLLYADAPPRDPNPHLSH